ncbi:transcription elongation factor GreA [Candidatus Parcubacteria bacterium A4]|nr:MAG: transcription elongation factor GreA [Candidatus Parcubacteria bacterium A4]
MTKYLTKEGLEKLKKELDYLKNVKRKEVSTAIKYAADFGDLKENAAYDEAKDAQGFIEGRIVELEMTFAQAKVIETNKNGRVQIGSIVSIQSSEMEQRFHIVGQEEADIIQGKISYQSPLGSALINKSEGENVKIKIAERVIEYKIVKVE